MKFKKKFLVILMAITLVSAMTVYAADPYLSYGLKSGKTTVKSYSNSYNDVWVKILDNSRSAWNNASSHTNISTSSSSKNSIQAARFSDSWYGLCSQTYNRITRHTSKFVIKVNARTIGENAENVSNFAQSVTVHEFGHTFWLCDNPKTSSSSIMKYSRDRNKMTKPQRFDITNVNNKYK